MLSVKLMSTIKITSNALRYNQNSFNEITRSLRMCMRTPKPCVVLETQIGCFSVIDKGKEALKMELDSDARAQCRSGIVITTLCETEAFSLRNKCNYTKIYIL